MLENGFIKLHRSLLKWEWYDDLNTFKVFIHLLLTVSIEDSQWHGQTIKRGSRVTSYAVLSKEMGISVKALRTAINHLERTGEVARSKTSKYSIIAIQNYDLYQTGAGKTASEGQAEGKQGASEGQQYKKVKESIRKNKNTPIPPKGDCQSNLRFVKFWDAYPKKRSQGDAEKAWKAINPDDALLDQMLKAIEAAKKSTNWIKEEGHWIPYPATWLRAKGWVDKIEVEVEEPKSRSTYDISEYEQSEAFGFGNNL